MMVNFFGSFFEGFPKIDDSVVSNLSLRFVDMKLVLTNYAIIKIHVDHIVNL